MRRTRLIGVIAGAVGALALLPAVAPAAVQVGSSGWLWGNPLPQGNTIRAMSFAGTQGYASGDFGTLLRTTDAGATWTGLLSGTFTNLTEVQAIDADSLFAGGGCVARRSDDGGATFKRLAFPPGESGCRGRPGAHAPPVPAGPAALPRSARRGVVPQPGDRLPRAQRRHGAAHRQRRR